MRWNVPSRVYECEGRVLRVLVSVFTLECVCVCVCVCVCCSVRVRVRVQVLGAHGFLLYERTHRSLPINPQCFRLSATSSEQKREDGSHFLLSPMIPAACTISIRL